ncbi:MAG: RNA polymerase sigma factor [Myxococcota bacterium]
MALQGSGGAVAETDDEARHRVAKEDPPRRRAAVQHLTIPDDAELVRRMCAGDSWAEEALYRRYAKPLGNLAARILGDRDAALDVVQDTFVEAFESIEKLRQPERVGAWLRQITVHQVHRRLRRRTLRRRLGFVSREVGETIGSEGTDAGAELRLVAGALREVSSEARICWFLRVVEGQRIGEIAEACRCSESTVKRRLREAERRVAAHVADLEGTP